MLTRRIIPCLDVRDGQVVKGVQFRDHTVLGDIVDLARRYRDQGADELVFYDITASAELRTIECQWVERVAAEIDIPFCVAGGIRSVESAERILNAGADKISINSPALQNPGLITELADAFGSQCVVVGIDSRAEVGDYWVYQLTGSEKTIRSTRRRTEDWIREAQLRGAGEIVLNCMNADGTKAGYDITQLRRARDLCQIPLIASGGAGNKQDFLKVFEECDVDGALAAGIFHRGELTIPNLKSYLSSNQMGVRT
ncbi:imidazole glycerol phosphate synthase subunit HisF [Planctomyces bekefii]|uniref:Imidazole glycerol phosphate synthase subunit HisF n=1 Tax=Planctomyces bekefii TaxID=1653850 RepID=A0A5C6MBE7_9PLAN|nr:imidazole glycerol phosphate synthase subunit HisF [Planctomyces bekefii]